MTTTKKSAPVRHHTPTPKHHHQGAKDGAKPHIEEAPAPEPAAVAAAAQPADDLADTDPWRAAYARCMPDMLALTEDELIIPNTDPANAAIVSLSAAHNIAPYRAQIATDCPTADHAAIDALEDRARCLAVANAKLKAAAEPPEQLASAAKRALVLRTIFSTNLRALEAAGIATGIDIDAVTGDTGYLNVGEDLRGISTGVRGIFDQIKGKTAITVAHLDAADAIVETLTQGLASRNDSAGRIATATDMRNRAYTLAMRSYDAALRVMTFIRWDNGDVATIVPSLYPGHASATKPITPAPVVTAPSTTVPVAPTSATAQQAKLPPNHPDASPFAS